MENSTTPPPLALETTPCRPRWALHYQAQMWRFLMQIGMFFHKIPAPPARSPQFTRTIPTSVSPNKGWITLHFYVPSDYTSRRIDPESKRFPVVVNFHGGGFTLGNATDDARWCNTVVEEVGAIVVSVDYRRAPEHPFPTAVEDGVDAILYLAAKSEDFHIDVDKIGLSGFSSGGNMCFTVPLRLQEELEHEAAEGEVGRPSVDVGQRPALQKSFSRGRIIVALERQISIRAVCSWYPPTDYTITRAQRRATAARIDQQLPAIFTDLFDESYLQPPTMDMSNPYLSPGTAPDYMLAGMPDEIILFTCEWDMLLAEAERFRDRLVGLGKMVLYNVVPNAPHGWDKAPNPLKVTPGVREQYLKACDQLKRVFDLVEESE